MRDECDKCGKTGVKLWREYGVYSRPPGILCVDHASELDSIEGSEVAEDGSHPSEFSPNQRSYDIGWYVPALPVEGEDAWWGATSAPEEAFEAWKALPLR